MVTAGVGGVPCARVKRRGPGLWDSWGTPWVPGKNLGAASEQPHWKLAEKILPHIQGCVLTVVPCVTQWPYEASTSRKWPVRVPQSIGRFSTAPNTHSNTQ